ncbi:uncharacterized protein [Battus philenor]|uniref:uncharacterized protein n=1 Tax=Battus philenor TaxID=42288 RepID=UPI0035CF4D4F
MSYPPPGQPPPYYGPPPPWPYPPYPAHQPPHYPPPPDRGQTAAPYPYFVPGTMMVPVPLPQESTGQATYITNYIYHGETSASSAPGQVQIAETAGDFDWVPTTATTSGHLAGKAVLGGHEGWDGSPLWVIRAWHNGELIPGKLSVRHCSATVTYDGKEVPVQNIEVLCARADQLRWVPASNGSVPPGAVAGGRAAAGEPLYVGRARHQLSVTPGKVHASHACCYIGFGGAEVVHKMYDVLCRAS